MARETIKEENGRERCPECRRLLPAPKEPTYFPICKLCEKPLIKAGHFWVCSDKNMSHRGLIAKGEVKKAYAGKKPTEAVKV